MNPKLTKSLTEIWGFGSRYSKIESEYSTRHVSFRDMFTDNAKRNEHLPYKKYLRISDKRVINAFQTDGQWFFYFNGGNRVPKKGEWICDYGNGTAETVINILFKQFYTQYKGKAKCGDIVTE